MKCARVLRDFELEVVELDTSVIPDVLHGSQGTLPERRANSGAAW